MFVIIIKNFVGRVGKTLNLGDLDTPIAFMRHLRSEISKHNSNLSCQPNRNSRPRFLRQDTISINTMQIVQ